MLSGKGNPNGTKFAQAVAVLYSLAYAVKMLPKKGLTPEGYFVKGLKSKKPHPLLDEVKFASLEEGLCVQILHIGS